MYVVGDVDVHAKLSRLKVLLFSGAMLLSSCLELCVASWEN